jgi:hypothetical protein
LSWLLSTLSTRRRASMVFRTSRWGPRRLLTAYVAAPAPSLRAWSGKEADSGRGLTALQPAHALSTCLRRSSLLAASPHLRATPSTAGALVAPRRSRVPGSHAAAWPQRQGSGMPAEKVVVRRCSRRHLRHHWRVGCCRAPACVPAAWVCGRAVGPQLDVGCAGCHSPRGVPLAQKHHVLGFVHNPPR